MRASESRARSGEFPNCAASIWRSAPSKAGSPVAFAKSAENDRALISETRSRRRIAAQNRPNRQPAEQDEREPRGCTENRRPAACEEICAHGTIGSAATPTPAGARYAFEYRPQIRPPKRIADPAFFPEPSSRSAFRSPSTRRRREAGSVCRCAAISAADAPMSASFRESGGSFFLTNDAKHLG